MSPFQNEAKVQNQDVNQQRLHMLTAGVYRDLLGLAAKHGDAVVASMENNQFADLPALAPLASISSQRIATELFNRAYQTNKLIFNDSLIAIRYNSLQQSVVLSKEGKGSSKAFLKFGLFCDNALKQRKESSTKVQTSI